MDACQKAFKYHNHSVLSKFLKNSLHSEKPLCKGSLSENCKKPIRWYCQDCCLLLSSEMQAQEHLLGKKHQNVIKSKGVISNSNSEIQLYDKWPVSNRLLLYDKFEGGCYYRSSSGDNCWRSKNGINNLVEFIPPPAGRDNILDTVIKNEKKTILSWDLSIYRTPSGRYYCQPCNLTVNSQVQFLQHSESRKHRQKFNKASSKVK